MKECPKCGFKPKTTRLFRPDGTPRLKTIGRPRKVDHRKARALRDSGLYSLSQIAEQLGVSKGAIEYATRKLK